MHVLDCAVHIYHIYFDKMDFSLHMCYLQMYRLNVKGQLAVGERCIESPSGDSLHLSFCDTQPTGPWFWDEVSCSEVLQPLGLSCGVVSLSLIGGTVLCP